MFRLMILMGMGLGALYMMHLLAQDYNKIRKPVQQAARLLTGASGILMRGKRDAVGDDAHLPAEHQATVDWKRILSRDPFDCLLSLICQVMSGAEHDSREALSFMDFLEYNHLVAPAKIGRAFSRGLALRGSTERCYEEYPFCLYSAKTMLRILHWLSDEGYTV